MLLTVGRSYLGNDVTHSTLLDRACACSYENLHKYRSYRVSNAAPCYAAGRSSACRPRRCRGSVSGSTPPPCSPWCSACSCSRPRRWSLTDSGRRTTRTSARYARPTLPVQHDPDGRAGRVVVARTFVLKFSLLLNCWKKIVSRQLLPRDHYCNEIIK